MNLSECFFFFFGQNKASEFVVLPKYQDVWGMHVLGSSEMIEMLHVSRLRNHLDFFFLSM